MPAASLFNSVSTKKSKLQQQEILKQINPDNTLESVLDKLGGKLCIYKGFGNYNYKQQPVVTFAWFHSNFENVMELSKTIELDASFQVLSPDVFCVPQLIYRNTGIPQMINLVNLNTLNYLL